MSQISNIAVYDGAATPVLHTLLPVSVTRDKNRIVAEWRESAAGVPNYANVRATAVCERLKSGVWHVDFRVAVPVMEAVNGQNAAGYTAAPKVAYEDTVGMYGYFSDRSLTTGRRLARQLVVNIGNNVSTSVAPATSGPLVELFDLLVSVT